MKRTHHGIEASAPRETDNMEIEPYEYWQNDQLEEAFRPPMLVTLVFVIVMLAVYFMSRSTQNLYPTLNETPEPIALVID